MIDPDQLTGFRLIHAGFRAEFARLADAIASPTDQTHAALLEEQLALILDLLHSHHVHEDAVLWPTLVARAPESATALAELEAEHDVLDPLIEAAADRGRPIGERAESLRRLHLVVNDHLDHEEQVALPLMLRVLTLGDIAADKQRAMEDFGRRRVPLIFGWLASCADEDLFAAAVADLPMVPRVLFRRFWWPSYQRRFVRLYGAAAGSLVLGRA